MLAQIAQTLVNCDIGFEILPVAASPAAATEGNPHEVVKDWIQTNAE